MQRIFNLDPQLLQDAIILAVNIFILFLLGSYLLFNPVRNLLKKRQDNVAAEIEAARKSKEEADALKAQYDEKLKNADTAVISEAKEEAGRIIKRADNEIELEKKKAADDMKKEMIAVATMMAGKVVSASIDTDIQESLVDETLNEMGDNTWRN